MKLVRMIAFAAFFFALSSGCGGSSNDGGQTVTTVNGRASSPVNGAALANLPVRVNTFTGGSALAKEVSDAGTTDDLGQFFVDVFTDSPISVVSVVSDPGVGGLVITQGGLVTRELNSTTDLSARAYVASVEDGTSQSGNGSQSLIDRLEGAAQSYLDSNEVDFTNPDSIAAAAAAVRGMAGLDADSGSGDPSGTQPEGTPPMDDTPTEDDGMGQECFCADGFGPVAPDFMCADGSSVSCQ